jgi:predicted SAM-dependent methyltransferase
MKSIIRDWVKKVGFDIVRVHGGFDTEIYKKYYPKESIDNKRFYNIGAGSFYHPCWTNIDNQSEWYDEIFGVNSEMLEHDLFLHEKLPVDDNSAELIYFSHILEHLNNESVQYILNESYRILKPGGIVRIVAPDIDLEYAAWSSGDRSFFYWENDLSNNENVEKKMLKIPLKEASITQLFIEDFATHASELVLDGAEHRISDDEFKKVFNEKTYEEALDYCTGFCPVELQKKYPYRHMNWFNETKMMNMLGKAGFTTCYRSRYRQSAAFVMRNGRFFDNTLPVLSLYVEAVK